MPHSQEMLQKEKNDHLSTNRQRYLPNDRDNGFVISVKPRRRKSRADNVLEAWDLKNHAFFIYTDFTNVQG